MAQLDAGTTYATGGEVTASNLNAHVTGARLLSGAITEQTSAGSVGLTDNLLISQGGALKKATVTQLLANADLTPYVKKDGTVAMTGELTLSSSTPAAALSASSKGYVDASIAPLVPTGAIMAFYRSTAPAGWRKCDGTTISSSGETAALYALIGATLPDLQGQFIRGLDQVGAVDPGRTLGQAQLDDFKAHTHLYGAVNGYGGFTGYGTIGAGTAYGTSSTGGTETRPKNVAFLYCIKL